MPKPFPLMIEVEEIALGPVLRKLNEMSGITKIHLPLGRGGEGAGKHQLEQHAAKKHSKGDYESMVVRLLMQGPKHIREIGAAVGGKITRAYGVMNSLKKQGISEPAGGGMHKLTDGTLSRLKKTGNGAAKPLALPAPAAVAHGPSGRASKGASTIVLRAALDEGPQTTSELRARLVMSGVSGKSTSGAIFRAKRDGIIKKNGSGYELTAKGQKIDLGAPANG